MVENTYKNSCIHWLQKHFWTGPNPAGLPVHHKVYQKKKIRSQKAIFFKVTGIEACSNF